jgi:hypothetical protein
MYTVYRRFSESFSQGYEISKVSKRDAFYFPIPNLDQYKFVTEDGDTYTIMHAYNPRTLSDVYNNYYSETLRRDLNFYTLDFIKIIDPSKSFSPNNTTQDIHATRNFMKVFSTVISSALSYYSDKEVDILGLSGKNSEAGRSILYKKLALRFSSQGGGIYLGYKDINFIGESFTQNLVLSNTLSEYKESLTQEFKIISNS